ncbi:hypothetical protein NPIL_578141 [Nephila pilipes]|uniref:Secreted protein n=1 Tax=Nephila pilipes TaxID=299642 RepID=A0A8X6TWG6_NEPPI|nr:hypothetical protein NPIL_578141 [Nephila pilipes]
MKNRSGCFQLIRNVILAVTTTICEVVWPGAKSRSKTQLQLHYPEGMPAAHFLNGCLKNPGSGLRGAAAKCSTCWTSPFAAAEDGNFAVMTVGQCARDEASR